MSTLVLTPTQMEQTKLQAELGPLVDREEVDWAVCGFGPIAAGVRTMQLLQTLRPKRVVLAGIAGAFGDKMTVGEAYLFEAVASYGIGVGQGGEFQTASELGWPQWPGDGETDSATIEDRMELDTGWASERAPGSLLVTTPSASANASDTANRLSVYPEAAAEDMEGFAVAMACRLAETPLEVVRGISNRVGERDKSRWQIASAMSAAAERVNTIVNEVNRTNENGDV